MMFTLRRDSERFHDQRQKQRVWLTFCPKDDADALAAGFGALTVLNEMRLPPGETAPLYGTEGAEIITYVEAGGLAYEDSVGNSGVTHAGEFRLTTTGVGIRHKETNASRTAWAHVFRISLYPAVVGLACAHVQKRFTVGERRNVLCVIASPDGRKGSLPLAQDAIVYSGILDPGRHVVVELAPGRSAWLHLLSGEATINGLVLSRGDGVGVSAGPSISFTVSEHAEIMLINLGPARSADRNNPHTTLATKCASCSTKG